MIMMGIGTALQEQNNGIGAGGDKGAAAQFDDAAQQEFLQQQCAGALVDAAVAEDGRGQDQPGQSTHGQKLRGAFDKQRFNLAAVGGQVRQQCKLVIA